MPIFASIDSRVCAIHAQQTLIARRKAMATMYAFCGATPEVFAAFRAWQTRIVRTTSVAPHIRMRKQASRRISVVHSATQRVPAARVHKSSVSKPIA